MDARQLQLTVSQASEQHDDVAIHGSSGALLAVKAAAISLSQDEPVGVCRLYSLDTPIDVHLILCGGTSRSELWRRLQLPYTNVEPHQRSSTHNLLPNNLDLNDLRSAARKGIRPAKWMRWILKLFSLVSPYDCLVHMYRDSSAGNSIWIVMNENGLSEIVKALERALQSQSFTVHVDHADGESYQMSIATLPVEANDCDSNAE